MRNVCRNPLICSFAFLLASQVVIASEPAREPLVAASKTPTRIDWQLAIDHAGGILTIAGPAGFVLQQDFGANESPSFALEGPGAQPEGAYTYQLWAAPRLDAETRQALVQARGTGRLAAIERELRQLGKLPAEPVIFSGVFMIQGGSIIPDGAVEAPTSRPDGLAPAPKDDVIADDLIVEGNACIGDDCANGESFELDTLRVKANIVRIGLQDTSTAMGLPTSDWQLTANDSGSGGANKFSIEDVTGGTTPFTIEAATPNNSLFVDDGGRLGLGTAAPLLDLHLVSGDRPAIRFEQDGSSSLTPQTWDIAGDETSFFIRDVTAGSTLPFQITTGAPTNSFFVASDGDVGIGTASPAQKLEVAGGDVKVGRTTGGNTSLFLENTGGTTTSSWIVRANGTTGGLTLTELGGNTSFRINTGALTNALTITSTGVDVLGTLRVNGTVMNVPDYVFEPTYALLPIEKQGEYMLANKHLPAVGAAEYDEEGRAMIDVGRNQMGMLEELEKAHLYLQQLDGQLKAKAEQLSELAQKNAALEARLARLEAALE